ncbi:hypothetical protein CDAR_242701 [Caerostris darwini]|uniref:Uncharacterized protein n=1 Tax=Caerostris darwini TaxID=1538125 RepID=A0AAV4MZV6_9ARAC|nr:hypothetical protein CDAR_242701 [Caerostris darwini]
MVCFSFQSRKADEDGHFNDDDEDHFLGIDSEDGHEDEEPLPPLALPLQNVPTKKKTDSSPAVFHAHDEKRCRHV